MKARVIQGFFCGGRPKMMVPGLPAQFPVGATAPSSALSGARGPIAQAQGVHNSFAVDPTRLGLVSGGGRPLPDSVRSHMEQALGADFSAVRVHVGPQADRIGAVAFAVDADIYFAPGRFQPDTVQGRQLLGHELAHVIQQRQGRVRNPLGSSGVAVVQDQMLEAEADRLGHKAAAHRLVVQANPLGRLRPSPSEKASLRNGTNWQPLQRRVAAAGVIQRVPCPLCGGSGNWYWDGGLGGWVNGHASSCIYYQRQFETQSDRTANHGIAPGQARQRSYSFRELGTQLVQDQHGTSFPVPVIRRVHHHDNVNSNAPPQTHYR
jgi:hypothetical protein